MPTMSAKVGQLRATLAPGRAQPPPPQQQQQQQQLHARLRDHGHSATAAPRTRSASHAVHIVLAVGGHVVVDDHINLCMG